MSKKSRKKLRSKALLCSFGFPLEPRCTLAYAFKFDLTSTPELREAIMDGTIPPYCYQFVDDNTVLLDKCLVCHMQKGITPQEYERKNERAGITRDNYRQLAERYDLIKEAVENKIRAEREELIKRGAANRVTVTKQMRDS